MRAELAGEALGDDAVDRGGDQECLDPHLGQPHDRPGGVVGVKRGEHHVPGQRRLDRDPRRLAVADLADHHDVRVGAQDRAQPGGEVEAGGAVDVDLVDAVEAVLDRVLDRDDVLLDFVHVLKGRVEGGGLARAGRPGDQHRAVGLTEGALEPLTPGAVHSEFVERALGVVLVEDADGRPLAALGRQGGDAQVDAAILDRDADPPVLGNPFLGDVEVAHDLDPRDDRVDHPLRNVRGLAQHPVDPEANPHLSSAGSKWTSEAPSPTACPRML